MPAKSSITDGHRRNLATANPHLLVTRGAKADCRPASAAYFRHMFDPVGHAPKDMRATPLEELASPSA